MSPLRSYALDFMVSEGERLGTDAARMCRAPVGTEDRHVQPAGVRADGSPAHTRGITAFPGLYVAGYPWLSNRGSGILYGVAADAARIAQHIASDARGVGAEPLALTHHEIQSVGAQR